VQAIVPRCDPSCDNIPDATATSYLAATNDVGKSLRVVVAAVNSTGFLDAASPERGPILAAASSRKVTATLMWAFQVRRKYAVVARLEVIHAPVGATITVFCRGRGCPFARESRHGSSKGNCRQTKHRRCAKPPVTVDVSLAGPFHHSHLALDATLTVKITKPGYIGKAFILHIPRASSRPSSR
jgi:hypothetical protein